MQKRLAKRVPMDSGALSASPCHRRAFAVNSSTARFRANHPVPPPPPSCSTSHHTLSEIELVTFRTQLCDYHRRSKCEDADACPHSHCLTWQRRNPYDFLYFPQLCPGIEFRRMNKKMCLVRHCNRGRHCTFAHSKEEELYHPLTYKTRLCSVFPSCGRHYCPFAHFPEEVRDPFSVPLVRMFWGSQAAAYSEDIQKKGIAAAAAAAPLRPTDPKHQLRRDQESQNAACCIRSPPSMCLAMASTASPSTRQSLPLFGGSADDGQTLCNNAPSMQPSTSTSSGTARELHQHAANSATDSVQANEILPEGELQERPKIRNAAKAATNAGNLTRFHCAEGNSSKGIAALWSAFEEAQSESGLVESPDILPLAVRLLGPQAGQMSFEQIELTVGLAVKLALQLQPCLQQDSLESPTVKQQEQLEEQVLDMQRGSADGSQQELQDALAAVLQAIGMVGQKNEDERRPSAADSVSEKENSNVMGFPAREAKDAAAALAAQLQILSLDESVHRQMGAAAERLRESGGLSNEEVSQGNLEAAPVPSPWQGAAALHHQAVAAAYAAAASRECLFPNQSAHDISKRVDLAVSTDALAASVLRGISQFDIAASKSLTSRGVACGSPPGLTKNKRQAGDFRRPLQSAFTNGTPDCSAAGRYNIGPSSVADIACGHSRGSAEVSAEEGFPPGCWSGHSLQESYNQREDILSRKLHGQTRPAVGKKVGLGRPQYSTCFDRTFSESCTAETKQSPEMTTCAQTPPTATTPSPVTQDSYSPTAATGIVSCGAAMRDKSKCLSRSTSPEPHAVSSPRETKSVIANARDPE